MKHNPKIASAIAGILSIGACHNVEISSTLDNRATPQALSHPEKPVYAYEKCYGVARQGQNSCFSNGLSCAGTATEDGQKNAWIFLPEGTCKKIVGGQTEKT